MIYFLPGRGSSFHGRLGTELQSRGYELSGRVLEGEFAKLSFLDQINLIADDLAKHAKQETPLIAHSFGAYLGLHAILQNKGYAGKVLLIAPILGAVKGNGRMFKPPQSKRIAEAIETRQFPKLDVALLVGDQDWQSPLDECEKLVAVSAGTLNTALGKGHDLGAEIVKPQLDAFF
jgi:pimeloyl-ACP methyl ester carboxylesterase